MWNPRTDPTLIVNVYSNGDEKWMSQIVHCKVMAKIGVMLNTVSMILLMFWIASLVVIYAISRWDVNGATRGEYESEY